MKNQFLYTNELAKLFNVSEHTIRFYEKKGLLKPSHITDAGYKLYGFYAISRLEQIVSLRFIGMPIDKIIDYLEHKCPQYYLEQLDALNAMVEKKLQQFTIIKSDIKARKERVNDYLRYQNNIFIKQFPTQYLLQLARIETDYISEIKVPDFFKSAICNPEHMSLKNSKNLVIYKKNKCRHLCIQVADTDLSNINLDQCFKLPAGNYLCQFYTVLTKEDYKMRENGMAHYIQQHHLKVLNTSIDIYSSDYNIYQKGTESSLYQIPLVHYKP